jgi:DNA-3-methyladenine glycosylase II
VIAWPNILDRTSLLSAVGTLTRRDRRLAMLVGRYGPPPLWARRPGFTTLLRIILEQQVSLGSAAALYRRLADAVCPLSSVGILALGTAGLRGLGLTRQKARYAHALAEQVTSGHLALHRLSRCTDAEVRERLTEVPGVGPWTASIYLLMALRRSDIWPPGDLALHHALARLYGSPSGLTAGEVEDLTARWRPLRAVAARILWHSYLEDRTAWQAHAASGRFWSKER